MLSRAGTRTMFALTLAVCTGALLMSVFNDPVLPCPLPVAIACRVVAMLVSGSSVAMMIGTVVKAARIKVDPGDTLIRPAVGLAHSFLALNLFAILALSEKMKTPGLTWRTPFLGFVVSYAVWCYWKLTGRFDAMLRRAPRGLIKLTLVDTAAYSGNYSADLDTPTNCPGVVVTPIKGQTSAQTVGNQK